MAKIDPLKLKINLLSQERLEERVLGKFLKWSLTFGRYIIVGTEIIVLLAFFSRFRLDRELSDLSSRISQKEAIVKHNQDFEEEVRDIQRKLDEIKKIQKNSETSLELLNFLENNMPKEVTLSNFTYTSERVSFSGASSTTSSFLEFLARVRTSEKFSHVVLSKLTKSGKEKLSFALTANPVGKENSSDEKASQKSMLVK